MLAEILWPRCAKCHKAADVSPDEARRLWAACCGVRTTVRLAFVPSDARPMKVGEAKKGGGR
jgi:hypothetical protein